MGLPIRFEGSCPQCRYPHGDPPSKGLYTQGLPCDRCGYVEPAPKTIRRVEISDFHEVTVGCYVDQYGCHIKPSWFQKLRGKRVRLVLEVEE